MVVATAVANTQLSEVQANRRRALGLCVALAAVPAVILGLIVAVAAGVLLGVIALVVVGVGLAAGLWWGSTSMALRRIHARDLNRSEEPRLLNVTQGLCATMGLAEPFVMTIDDDVPNACAIGKSPDDAVVIVTTGLTRRLDLVELEGVIAHELAHVQRGDIVVAGVVLAICGGWCRMLGGGRWVHGVLGHGREYRADQVAVAAVRYPPGLRDALGRLRPAVVPTADSVFAGPGWDVVRWAWLDPSLGDAASPPAGELDATSVRLEALDQY
jgi:Zn-dependent protease with chaperone function